MLDFDTYQASEVAAGITQLSLFDAP